MLWNMVCASLKWGLLKCLPLQIVVRMAIHAFGTPETVPEMRPKLCTERRKTVLLSGTCYVYKFLGRVVLSPGLLVIFTPSYHNRRQVPPPGQGQLLTLSSGPLPLLPSQVPCAIDSAPVPSAFSSLVLPKKHLNRF